MATTNTDTAADRPGVVRACNRVDVTAVISTFNRARFLPDAIESLLAQTVRPVRIVVVDDGSTDATAEAVHPYLGEVEYVWKENAGKACALNRVLSTVTTEFAWFFDDDDAAYPDALQNLFKSAASIPALGFVFGSLDLSKSDGWLLTSAVRPGGGYPFATEAPGLQRLRLFRNCTVQMSGSLIRTAAIRAIGGLNEAMIRCQDYDMMVRLAAAYPFAYCGSTVYVLREHDGTRGSAGSLHEVANRVAVWAKYNEPIGHFLRYSLPLSDFLAYPGASIDDPGTARAALISRAWALAPKAPLELAVDDLLDAFCIEPHQPLTVDEVHWLRETFHDDFVSFRPRAPLWRLWRLGMSVAGRAALGQLATGVYWLGRRQAIALNRMRWSMAAVFLFGLAAASKTLHAIHRLARFPWRARMHQR